jgi:hypothetical protein
MHISSWSCHSLFSYSVPHQDKKSLSHTKSIRGFPNTGIAGSRYECMFQSFTVLLSYADRNIKTGQSLSKESIKRRLRSSGFNIIWFGKCRTFRRNISSPSSPSNSKASMKSAEKDAKQSSFCRLIPLISCLAYSSTRMMETICSAEKLDSFRTTQRYNPEERTLRSHHHENLKSNPIKCPRIFFKLNFKRYTLDS